MNGQHNQRQVWNKFWQGQDFTGFTVKEYHRDIKRIIDAAAKSGGTSIEIGSGIGITSLILSENMACTLLDYDAYILERAALLFKRQQREACFFCCDMFHLDEIPEKYDVVFNSGVVEHYTVEERARLLREYKKVLKPDGVMVIAVPNHYCLPYKLGYVALRMAGRWMFPKEYAIKNLSRELREAGLVLQECIIASDNLIEDSIKSRWLKRIYRWAKKIFRFQGYLRVFIIRHS
ncbi:MAG: class I SAM-dependent methyltransferase [Tannerellaceae bacterium]|jgi:2-polyprenyl-3-methyl-5-hydroxy-6-metoxy-1,4-benzoquinol methylase|nr:class I SAM-dependent methyltransferase [Tannerellaceae bacterium]